MVFSSVIEILALIVGKDSGKVIVTKNRRSNIFPIRALVTCLGSLSFLILILIWSWLISGLDENIEFITKSNCSDSFTNKDFGKIEEQITDTNKWYRLSWILLIVLISLYAIASII